MAPGRTGAAPALQQAGRTGAPCGTTTTQSQTTGTTGTTGTAATPAANQGAAEFDQLFIDMNIPHHASIVAMSAAALTRLESPRLRALASDTILDQTLEINDLRGLRERLYGESLPQPFDQSMMDMMASMPGMENMDPAGLAMQLDPGAMAAQLCTAENPDLTYIDLTIAHHQVAVAMARAALDQASDSEVKAMAAHALRTQQSQIDELQDIRTSITG